MENEIPEDFAAFYEQSRNGCLRAVYAVVGDPALAEDLTAEAFTRAFAQWRKVRRHPAPKAWVVRVALNVHMSRWRRSRREVPLDERGADYDRAGTTTTTVLNAEPMDERTKAAVRALPRRQREVIALRIFLDLDTETTARAMGIAPGSVKSHLHRASAALRSSLTPDPDQEVVSQ